ncbi:MAG: class I SAM-dependent methyltransferase [Verrucomicrobiae bacterium]|nr:class I SAM-dependent methyltransferase [Verrucomicrobiae bacterium]
MKWIYIKKGIKLLFVGEWRRVYNEVHAIIYRAVYEWIGFFAMPLRKTGRKRVEPSIEVITQYPIAFESPDHIAPKGTAENNSTNKKFILHMDRLLSNSFPKQTLNVLDLGCSGGQMINDFLNLCWVGVGLEGSDYSLKRKRANWGTLANRNLFTCDITKPFQVNFDKSKAKFHLITAWEVLEHIATPDLLQLFRNISDHLEVGGCFIASTTPTPDIHEGIELHQTKWENEQWRNFVETNFPELEYADVGLKIYQYVRYNLLHPSFLIYRKRR